VWVTDCGFDWAPGRSLAPPNGLGVCALKREKVHIASYWDTLLREEGWSESQ
jgi:hypothetical protein